VRNWTASLPKEHMMADASPEEILRILVEFDIDTALTLVPLSRPGLEVGMHKARLHHPDVPLALKQASLDWLRAGNWRDMYDEPLPATAAEAWTA
jgi:hypothetical protein